MSSDDEARRRQQAQAAVDAAYQERNRLVALLAALYPSGIAKTAVEGWDAHWHNCVFIDTPEGQLSWHYHDREEFLFRHLPQYKGRWDGHTTPQKYARVERLVQRFFRHGWDGKHHHPLQQREPVKGDLVPNPNGRIDCPLAVCWVDQLRRQYAVDDLGNPFGEDWEPAPIEPGWTLMERGLQPEALKGPESLDELTAQLGVEP